MALINKLREKMGRLVVVIIGLAIMMFVLTDLFVGNGSTFLGQDNDVGDISGETVSFEEFQAQVDQLSGRLNPSGNHKRLTLLSHAHVERGRALGERVVGMVRETDPVRRPG